jgi:endonuclease YncB( thermonuclease family)
MTRLRGLLGIAAFVVLMPGLVAAEGLASPRYVLHNQGTVLDVEAPNLLRVRFSETGKIVTVRLLGVGSPRHRDRIKHLDPGVVNYIHDQAVWERGREFVRSLVRGKVVEVWARKWDQYDEKSRLLAYIVIPASADGSVDLNGEIIRNGMGLVTRDYVHVTFTGYRRLEDEARHYRRGLWRGLSGGRLSSLGK